VDAGGKRDRERAIKKAHRSSFLFGEVLEALPKIEGLLALFRFALFVILLGLP
jgi:hypothetical protein